VALLPMPVGFIVGWQISPSTSPSGSAKERCWPVIGSPPDGWNRRAQLEVQPAELERTAGLLANIGSAKLSVDVGRSALTIRVDRSVADLMSAALVLGEAGITPGELGLRRPSLDDVFLALTGQPTDGHPPERESVDKPPQAPAVPSGAAPEDARAELPRRTTLPVSAAFTDALLVARRNILRILRTPQLLVFAAMQPVMFVLLFRYLTTRSTSQRWLTAS
jgi:hypothetical protein